MQTANHGDLPRRARYYQAAADIDTTPKGSEYSDLKQNYVIFICTFDPFHCGKAMYHFANYCINHDFPIPLEDGTSKLFLNTAAKALDSLDGDLRLFYDYVRERTAQTTFNLELDSSISKLKQEQEERSMYLTYTSRMMECRRDGYEEGLFTGREEGAYQKALETARNFLSEGLTPQMVARCTNLPLETVVQLAKDET